ncbi:hypothetical protein N7517_001134 [Penicillium concentricum]|uniref:Uncharacterized protein n=1 Tax=Penicillium concentricum TaxID=293559 RepID=A0A9W9SRA6_9EURO|nr:uncharacterized protein N7517_001134 [Penicillium concentricum]KAJ5383223.1 hypothetical protein N7517_001134 [Penicillium concentricum]
MASFDLNGNWVLDKARSTNLDAVLKLQGIGWITRKAIEASKMTLKITQSSETHSSTGEAAEWITFEAALTSGLKGAPEKRPLTWTEFEHNDTIFGLVYIRSHYISGERTSHGVRPLIELQTKDVGSGILYGLTEAIAVDHESETAQTIVEKAFIHDFVRSVHFGWTAEQIWAVEIVGEDKFLTRRAVVVKGTSIESACTFYKRE